MRLSKLVASAVLLMAIAFVPSVSAHHGNAPTIYNCSPDCPPLTEGCPPQIVDAWLCAAENQRDRTMPLVWWIVDNDCHVWSIFC